MKFVERMNKMSVVQLTMLKREQEQEQAIVDYKRSLTVIPSRSNPSKILGIAVLNRLNTRLDDINSVIGRKSLATTP